ncbi:hypothetical protein CASFOL_028056 [Castilleja foliolosa]|uniref:Uncharacterized protein n=1 Tax=Castilleja foliolosa TaxID=1961234 RepID=A0ABD3CF52_9LAMI
MADNQVREDASAGEDGGFNHVEPAYGESAENAGDSTDHSDQEVVEKKATNICCPSLCFSSDEDEDDDDDEESSK